MTMTLEQVRDQLRKDEEFARGVGWPQTRASCLAMALAIDAHLTQPAQSVDVASVPTEFVEDIQRAERLAMKSKKLNRERMMGLAVVKHFGHLLTAALQEKGNG